MGSRAHMLDMTRTRRLHTPGSNPGTLRGRQMNYLLSYLLYLSIIKYLKVTAVNLFLSYCKYLILKKIFAPVGGGAKNTPIDPLQKMNLVQSQ